MKREAQLVAFVCLVYLVYLLELDEPDTPQPTRTGRGERLFRSKWFLTSFDLRCSISSQRGLHLYYHLAPSQFCTHRSSKPSFVFPASPDKTSYPLD